MRPRRAVMDDALPVYPDRTPAPTCWARLQQLARRDREARAEASRTIEREEQRWPAIITRIGRLAMDKARIHQADRAVVLGIIRRVYSWPDYGRVITIYSLRDDGRLSRRQRSTHLRSIETHLRSARLASR